MAVIFINRSDSRCGDCGQNAFPSEEGHFSSPTYGDMARKGCGALWTHVSSSYSPLDEDIVKGARYGFDNLKDLPGLSYWDAMDLANKEN